ncbi:MAG: hypothetical protein HY700_20600 [Gemmatimonadetes bacterium]|nr:hypothetical protein [Gemmatimonadota bacterium]
MRAQTAQQLVGAWKRVSWRDSSGASLQPPGPPTVAVYSAEGYFAQTGFPPGRPKKPLADMTREELLAVIQYGDAWNGTYRLSGNKLTRHILSYIDADSEGADVVQLFRIVGDTLILSNPNPANKREARFMRLK